jgi:uncharacterized protein (TIGR00369 family)
MSAGRAARTRTYEWQDPAPLVEAFRSRGGLAMLEGIAAGDLPLAPMTVLLGFRLEEVQPGRVVWSAEPTEEHYNEAGLIHGGLAAGLLETALGTTLVSTLPPRTLAAGLQLSVNFLRPLTPGLGRVLCEGRAVHVGSRVAVMEAELRAGTGTEVLARATSTFSLLREDSQ